MDKTRLDKIIRDFYVISGMEISVLDSHFHTVAVSRCHEGNLCSYVHRTPSATEVCKDSDIEHLTIAERAVEPIMYTCPYGITEAIVPIVRGDSIIAYIIASMGIKESDATSVLELTRKALPDIDDVKLTEYIGKMRHLSDAEADAYFSILKMIGEHISNDTTITQSDESIGTLVKYYVKNNLTRKLTLTDIAWNLHCSTVTLTEHFRAEFGITIMEYVTRKRMELAEKLLLSTAEPLREVAVASGFSDVEYFSRTFKKHHGISPAAWRKASKNV